MGANLQALRWYDANCTMWGRRGFGSSLLLPGLLFSLVAFGNTDDAIRHVGDGVTAPKLVHQVQPEYTKRAKKAKLHGVVKLKIVVASTGIPEDITVTDGLDPDLDAEAIKAVSQWRFEPAMADGKAVPVWVSVEVNFRLCCRW